MFWNENFLILTCYSCNVEALDIKGIIVEALFLPCF